MFIKHSFSLLIAVAASCLTFNIFESVFGSPQPDDEAPAKRDSQKSDYVSGGLEDDCTWIAVTVNDPIQCFENPVPMSYGPPSQFLLSKVSNISKASTELCEQISHLRPVEHGGAKTLIDKPVKWICPINQHTEGS